MTRRCNYRNCGATIPDSVRSDAKYCNIKCRDNERTYIKRDNRRIKQNKEQIVKNLIHIEKNANILDLYNKIYSK